MNTSTNETLTYSGQVSAGKLLAPFTLLTLSLLLNSFGTVCLCKHQGMRKQRVVLVNVSLAELCLSIYMLIVHSVHFWDLSKTAIETASTAFAFSHHVLTVWFYSSMIMLSADRFVCVFSPLKYCTFVRSSTLKKIAVGVWVFSFFSSVPFLFSNIDVRGGVIRYVIYVFQVVFVVLFVATYLRIFINLRRNATKLGRQHSGSETKGTKRVHVIPFLIIVTFMFFYQIPKYIRSCHADVRRALNYVGLCVDPVIYIFLHPALRRTAYSLLRCDWCNQDGGAAVESMANCYLTPPDAKGFDKSRQSTKSEEVSPQPSPKEQRLYFRETTV